MSRSRVSPKRERPADGGMPCDGTPQDYRRHSHYGEEPCAESREAWRVHCRMYRYTGVYDSFSTDDPSQVHPFFYKKAKRQNIKRDGKYPGKSRSKSKP